MASITCPKLSTGFLKEKILAKQLFVSMMHECYDVWTNFWINVFLLTIANSASIYLIISKSLVTHACAYR